MKVVKVNFRGDNLEVIQENQGIVVKDICESLGLKYETQYNKLKTDSTYESKLIRVKTKGGMQDVFCIPLSKLNGWLFSINPNKVKPEVRQKLIDYKNECFDVLYRYFNKENDSKYVPYSMLYAKERECIELRRAMNRITENEKLIFNDPQTHNEVLDLIGYASRATKTIKHLGQDLLEYGTNMEAKLASIQKKHGDKNGVITQCKRLPRHQEKKD